MNRFYSYLTALLLGLSALNVSAQSISGPGAGIPRSCTKFFDDGVEVGCGRNVDITGDATVTKSGNVVTIDITGGGSSSGGGEWGTITGTLSDQTDLQSALDAKVDENSAITGATKTKITYDAKGLVTAGADATTADIADSTNKRYVTDANLTVINNTSGTNTGNVTVSDTAEIDFSLTGQQISASLISASIDEAKLDTSVNASLDLADSAVQPATLAGYVQTSRTINGYDLSANRTLVTDDIAEDGSPVNLWFTDERAQDAVGAMVNSTLTYTDGTPLLTINLGNANTWTADQSVPDEAYGAGWNGSVEVPTKNAIYDKIETMGGSSGGVSDGDYGDITVSGSNTVWAIDDDVVTFAKMQNIATNSLMGRDTASTGDPENILLDDTLEMDGSGNLQRAALTGDITSTAGSNTTAIGSGVIIDADVNASAAIAVSKLAALTASRVVITDGSGFISAADTATYPSLTELSYVKGVTSALQTQLNGKQASDATLTSLAAVSGVQGDILYADGSDSWTRLAKNTSSTRYLSNTGTSNNPAWAQIDLSNGVTGDLPFANLTQGSARSVLGVTGNSTADVASIQGTADQVLRVDSAGTGLSFGTVATAGIAADAVTYAKIQNVSATDKLLGRSTAGAGDIEEIACNSVCRGLLDDTTAGAQRATLGLDTSGFTFIINGNGSTITTGNKNGFQVPYACTIASVTLGADQSGSIVIDIWKDTYANYPPTVADTITASAKPTISSTTKATDSTLTGWTKTVTAGDFLFFNVDSVTSITKLSVNISCTR